MSCIERKGGHLIVISGPSGVGKGTICREFFSRNMKNISQSVSATTRKPRLGETNGINYFFESMEKFESMTKNNQLLEYANVHGNYYGTPKEFVFEQMKAGNDVILEIDIQGATQVIQNYQEAVLIFIMPPTFGDLVKRIRNRGTENEEEIKKRLSNAHAEILAADRYDYIVVNDNIFDATDNVEAVIMSERCKRDRYILDFDSFIYKEAQK